MSESRNNSIQLFYHKNVMPIQGYTIYDSTKPLFPQLLLIRSTRVGMSIYDFEGTGSPLECRIGRTRKHAMTHPYMPIKVDGYVFYLECEIDTKPYSYRILNENLTILYINANKELIECFFKDAIAKNPYKYSSIKPTVVVEKVQYPEYDPQKSIFAQSVLAWNVGESELTLEEYFKPISIKGHAFNITKLVQKNIYSIYYVKNTFEVNEPLYQSSNESNIEIYFKNLYKLLNQTKLNLDDEILSLLKIVKGVDTFGTFLFHTYTLLGASEHKDINDVPPVYAVAPIVQDAAPGVGLVVGLEHEVAAKQQKQQINEVLCDIKDDDESLVAPRLGCWERFTKKLPNIRFNFSSSKKPADISLNYRLLKW